MSYVPVFDSNYWFQILFNYNGVQLPIGGGEVDVGAIHNYTSNATSPLQQWQIIETNQAVNNTPLYLIRLHNVPQGYLQIYCQNADECAVNENNRPRLFVHDSVTTIDGTGRWFIQPTSFLNGTYYLRTEANGTAAALDWTPPLLVYMANSSFNDGRMWLFNRLGQIEDQQFLYDVPYIANGTNPPPQSSGLSAGAKGGIAGGVVGGVLLISLMVGLWWWLRRKRLREKERQDSVATNATSVVQPGEDVESLRNGTSVAKDEEDMARSEHRESVELPAEDAEIYEKHSQPIVEIGNTQKVELDSGSPIESATPVHPTLMTDYSHGTDTSTMISAMSHIRRGPSISSDEPVSPVTPVRTSFHSPAMYELPAIPAEESNHP